MRWLAISAAGSALACDPHLDQPALADMSATVLAYEAPRGVLTEDNIEAMIAKAAPRLRQLEGAAPQRVVIAMMDELEVKLEERGVLTTEAKTKKEPLSVDASIRLRTRCAAEENTEAGTIELETRIDANELAPVIQGHAHRCRYATSDAEVEAETRPSSTIDGALFLYRYDPLGTSVEEARFLLVLDGTLSSSTHPELLGDLDLRVLGSSLETRIEVDGVEVIAFFDATQLGLRDARAVYRCSVEERGCSSSDGRTLSW